MASHLALQQAGGLGRGSLAGRGAGNGPLPAPIAADAERD